MTGPDTPAILMPIWFYGPVEQGRLVLHNGWVWFQPGTFHQEGGRVRFEPDLTSRSGQGLAGGVAWCLTLNGDWLSDGRRRIDRGLPVTRGYLRSRGGARA
jgi:hypothetical protein